MLYRILVMVVLSPMLAYKSVSAAEVDPLKETSCKFLLSAESAESEIIEVPGLSVLHPPEDQPSFVVEQMDGARLEAVICRRSRGEFADQDVRVLDAGFAFYVNSGSGEGQQTLVLEFTEVGYRVRVVAGPAPSEAQANSLRTQIGRFNRHRFGTGDQSQDR